MHPCAAEEHSVKLIFPVTEFMPSPNPAGGSQSNEHPLYQQLEAVADGGQLFEVHLHFQRCEETFHMLR